MKQWFFVLVLGGLLMGCFDKPIASLDITLLTTPPLPVEVSSSRIVVPQGIGVGIQIVCKDQEGERVDGTPFADFDPTGMSGAVGIYNTSTTDIYILEGAAVGKGKIELTPPNIADAKGVSFDFEVTEPPPFEP